MVLNVLLTILLFALPMAVGGIFRNKSFSFTYLSGQFVMWAAFEVIGVVAIYFRASFTLLFWIYTAMVVLLLGFGVRGWRKMGFSGFKKPEFSIFMILALLVIAYECTIYIFGMHLDEDDARWIAEANDALVKDRMLLHNPATGEYIGRFVGEMVKDVFSPWAFYLAWMSRLTGVKAVVLAHTAYPPVLLCLSYLVYFEMGKCLFKKNPERWIFVLMVSVINLFMAGNVYTQSVFTLTRIWQGKAVVAAVMIPAVLMAILRIQNEDTVGNWLFLAVIGTACCLFSGMGIAIGLLSVFVYGGYVIIRALILGWKNGLKRIPLWLLCLVPEIVYGLGYLTLKG